MNEQKAKCEATEKRESERRQVEEKKHNEEIQFLKRTNQQLKVSPVQARVEGLLPAPSPKLPPPRPHGSVSCRGLRILVHMYCQGLKEAGGGCRGMQGEGSLHRFSTLLSLEGGSEFPRPLSLAPQPLQVDGFVALGKVAQRPGEMDMAEWNFSPVTAGILEPSWSGRDVFSRLSWGCRPACSPL